MRNALYMREISVNEAKGAKMETIFLRKPTEKLSLNDGQLIVSEHGECQKEVIFCPFLSSGMRSERIKRRKKSENTGKMFELSLIRC